MGFILDAFIWLIALLSSEEDKYNSTLQPSNGIEKNEIILRGGISGLAVAEIFYFGLTLFSWSFFAATDIWGFAASGVVGAIGGMLGAVIGTGLQYGKRVAMIRGAIGGLLLFVLVYLCILVLIPK